MTDFLGYGKEKRRQGNLDILAGRVAFRYARVASSTPSGVPSVPLTFVQRCLSGDVREREQEWTHV